MKFDLAKTFTDISADVKNATEKHAPEALVIAGVVGLIGAGVLACRATLKAPKLVEKSQIRLETVKAKKEDELIDEKQYKKELLKAYAGVTLDWVKLYAPSVIIAGLSAGMIFESNDILKKRNASLAAAYTTLDGAFKTYRKNVVDKYGKEEDLRMLTGAKEETITEEEIDPETGKVKKVKKKVNVIDPNDIENWNGYARIFGKFPIGSVHYNRTFCESDKTNFYNISHLEAVQQYLNDVLHINKIVTLNDVYDELRFDRTKAGQMVGWVLGEKGDGYIDLRINENFAYREVDPETGDVNIVRGILIDPNCSYIFDSETLKEI